MLNDLEKYVRQHEGHDLNGIEYVSFAISLALVAGGMVLGSPEHFDARTPARS